MTDIRDQRGLTLVESLIAASLLLTLVSGVGYLFLLTQRFAARAEQVLAATTLATSRLDALRAIPWEYDIAGAEIDVPALDPSPSGTLDRSIEGFHDRLDAGGIPIDDANAGEPAFERRWAVVSAPVDPGNARGIEVCVFAWPAAAGARPLVCTASARARQP